MRSVPSIQVGGAGSGSGSGRYSSSGSNSMTFVRGCSGIPNEKFCSVLILHSSIRGKWARFWAYAAEKTSGPKSGPELQVSSLIRVGADVVENGVERANSKICGGALGSLE